MLAAGLSLAIGLTSVADKVLAAVIAAARAILFARRDAHAESGA
jgi:hypothetical protein